MSLFSVLVHFKASRCSVDACHDNTQVNTYVKKLAIVKHRDGNSGGQTELDLMKA